MQIQNFYTECKSVGFKEILKIEFELANKIIAPSYKENQVEKKYYMNKCGLLVINPPHIQADLKLNINYLIEKVYESQANCLIDLL